VNGINIEINIDMVDLNTNYAGLKLRNPIVISSSGLTDSLDKIKKIEDAGPGAVVLKSLFEEQIRHETDKYLEITDYPGAEDYLKHYVKSNNVDQYLELIEGAKQSVSIPIIASINCISSSDWIEFSKQIEKAGADALELNVFFLPLDKNSSSDTFENLYLELAAKVSKLISIPVIMKLGYNFTNLIHLVNQLHLRGISAVVLFNRFYSPDININERKMVTSDVFSSSSDLRDSLRWVAIISHFVNQIHIASSTGVHSGEAVIKQLLAGATAVHVCSVLYKKGPEYVTTLTEELVKWMEKNQFNSLEEFRGSMNYGNISDPLVYERAQFMKYYSSHD